MEVIFLCYFICYFFYLKYKVGRSMNFGDRNLSLNFEIFSFIKYYFIYLKIGDINFIYVLGFLGSFREKMRIKLFVECLVY